MMWQRPSSSLRRLGKGKPHFMRHGKCIDVIKSSVTGIVVYFSDATSKQSFCDVSHSPKVREESNELQYGKAHYNN